MSFTQSVRHSLTSCARVAGRSPRSEFWWFSLFLLLSAFAVGGLDALVGTPRLGEYGLLGWALIIVIVVPATTLTIRRFHDVDKNGWWTLVLFVPCLGFLLLLWLAFTAGTPGLNRYGDDPRWDERPEVTWPWRLLAWSTPVTAVGLLVTLGVIVNTGGGEELGTRVARNMLPEGKVLPQDLEVGECVDVPDGELVLAVPVVECSSQHDAEVFAVTQLEDGPFPGKRGVMRQVARFCLPKFEEFAGEPYRRNRGLDLFLFYPMKATWEDDRGVTCLAMDPEGPTTDTLLGTDL